MSARVANLRARLPGLPHGSLVAGLRALAQAQADAPASIAWIKIGGVKFPAKVVSWDSDPRNAEPIGRARGTWGPVEVKIDFGGPR